jgi:hypothetical protein
VLPDQRRAPPGEEQRRDVVKLPVREIIGNLLWATDGSVWATWRVSAEAHPYVSGKRRREMHAKCRAALMALGGDAMILGLCEPIDPDAVAAAMVDGVDLDTHPEWAQAAQWALDRLDDVALWARAYFLCVRLPEQSSLRARAGVAQAHMLGAFGVLTPRVAPAEVAVRARQAAEIADQIAGRLTIKAATAGDLRWIYARAFRRGLDDPVNDGAWEPAAGDGRAGSAQLLPLGEAEVLEGGRRDDPGRRRHRRYLRVEVPDVGVAYQTFAVIAEMPRTWSFPGGAGEWFAQVDELVFPVDWCARIRTVSNADAQVKARRQHRQLISQVDEYDSETSGPPAALAEAIADIDLERSALAANSSDNELQTTIIFALASDELDTLESRASQLKQLFSPQEYGIARPTGGQADLCRAMLPGSSCGQVVRDYTQYLLPDGLAAGAPFSGAEVGDRTGVYFGYQLDGYSCRPVLLNPAPPAGAPGSRSMGLFGTPDMGKSYALKLLLSGLVARGGQAVVLDRTKLAEYKRLAAVTPGTSQVVDLGAQTDVSLDPLRVFTGTERLTYTIGFLTVLLDTAPMEHDGTVLSDAVEAVIDRPDACLTDVVDALAERTDPAAAELTSKLRKIAKSPLGKIVFSDRPPVSLDADFIVFAAQGLHLPTRDQLLNAHLARRLLPEQMLSQALLYLVAAVTRVVTWARTDRFAVGVFDEVWALTNTVEGHQLLIEGARDGRKHNAAIWVAGQDPSDLGDLDDAEGSKLPSLIPIRMVFRLDHREPAIRGLHFLDLDVEDDLVTQLTTVGVGGMAKGQCLLRDVKGRVGRIQVVEAWSPQLAAAMETDPERLGQQTADSARPAEPQRSEVPSVATEGYRHIAPAVPHRPGQAWVRPSRRHRATR